MSSLAAAAGQAADAVPFATPSDATAEPLRILVNRIIKDPRQRFAHSIDSVTLEFDYEGMSCQDFTIRVGPTGENMWDRRSPISRTESSRAHRSKNED